MQLDSIREAEWLIPGKKFRIYQECVAVVVHNATFEVSSSKLIAIYCAAFPICMSIVVAVFNSIVFIRYGADCPVISLFIELGEILHIALNMKHHLMGC